METTIATNQRRSLVTTSDGERFDIFDDEVRVKVTGQEADGAYAMLTITTAPGGGPPLHAHHGPETFVVLSGEFTFIQRDGERSSTYQGGPGCVFHAPAGTPHRFENVSTTPSTLLIVSDPTVLDFLRETGKAFPRGSEPNMEKMLELNAKHHIEVFYGGEGSRSEPPHDGATSAAARALAWRFAEANRALIQDLEQCTPDQWRAICPDTGWSVAVQAHHLAVEHAYIAGLLKQIADDNPPELKTMDDVDEVNARHADAFANVSRSETVTLLRENGAVAFETYRRLSDDQLAHEAALLVGAPPSTVRGLIEYIGIGEILRHGQAIREAIGNAR